MSFIISFHLLIWVCFALVFLGACGASLGYLLSIFYNVGIHSAISFLLVTAVVVSQRVG
jgi:hypothetical protein